MIKVLFGCLISFNHDVLCCMMLRVKTFRQFSYSICLYLAFYLIIQPFINYRIIKRLGGRSGVSFK